MRTCIGCRTAAPWGQLVRVARDAQGMLLVARRAPGRGAWLCAGEGPGVPSERCLEQAARRQAFTRAFRAPVTTEVVGVLRRTMQERARIERGSAAGGAPRRD